MRFLEASDSWKIAPDRDLVIRRASQLIDSPEPLVRENVVMCCSEAQGAHAVLLAGRLVILCKDSARLWQLTPPVIKWLLSDQPPVTPGIEPLKVRSPVNLFITILGSLGSFVFGSQALNALVELNGEIWAGIGILVIFLSGVLAYYAS